MKRKTDKQLFPEWFKDGHKILDEQNSPKVDAMFKYYKKDRYLARVLYMNDSSGHENWKTILFTKKNGHFSIVVFRRKFGISVTNRMYSHEKRVMTINYNGKFYLINNSGTGGKTITQATLNNIERVLPFFGSGKNSLTEIVLDKIQERFSWLRFIREHHVLTNVAFNTIVKNKLYSLKKGLQHQYKVPLPVAKMLQKLKNNVHIVQHFKFHLPYMDNVESLKEEWLKKDSTLNLFHDSLRLAKIMDKKVSCSWSTRRLKEEHDEWSKELTDIIFIDGNRDLKIDETFIEFSKLSGYEMLLTTKDMAYEGKRQNHCVVSYVNKVETGSCGIYRVGEFTLEVIWGYSNGNRIIKIGQLRGYSNQDAPKYLEDEVLTKLVDFNQRTLEINVSKEQMVEPNTRWIPPRMVEDDLPF
jgi:hypothetical protein